MGHPAGGDDPQARVRRGGLTKLLRDIGPLRFGEGRECSFPAALATATKTEYDWLMGASGAAFDVSADLETFDPLAATPRDPETMALAARAAGVRLDDVPPPYDDDLRELVASRIREAIDDKLPPLIRGAVGPPEYGLIVGYTDDQRFLVRTFFDKDDKPSQIGWPDFIDADHGGPVFLDHAAPPERAVQAKDGLDAGLARAPRSEETLAAWAAALRDDARWADTKHAGTAAFAEHAMRVVLADKRRAAARFLRGLRSLFTTPGGDLLRAAESYGYVVDALDKLGTKPFDASVAMRFLDAGHRRGIAKALENALGHEREAHDALRAARATIR
ncbi:MAG: hypothetical protein QOH08_2589 [Chloroflexota bacterium]|nr:hypothetical protein [Chloroflexota bacterium]